MKEIKYVSLWFHFYFKGKTFHWAQGKYIAWALFHQTRVNFLMHIRYKYSMSTATLKAIQSYVQIYKLYCRFCDALPQYVNSDLMMSALGFTGKTYWAIYFGKKTHPVSLHFFREIALASIAKDKWQPKNPGALTST